MTFHVWYNDKENEYNFIFRCRTKICADWQIEVAQQNSHNRFGVLSNCHSYQPLLPNRSSSTLTLLRPSIASSLRFANHHSIAIAVQPLWNKLSPVIYDKYPIHSTNSPKPHLSISLNRSSAQNWKHCFFTNPIPIPSPPLTSLAIPTLNIIRISRLTVCLPNSLDFDPLPIDSVLIKRL